MKKYKIPENGKTFDFYAAKARDEMQRDLDQGTGRVIYKHYIGVIDNYLIPISGKEPIAGITPGLVSDYIDKLKKELGKESAQSTL